MDCFVNHQLITIRSSIRFQGLSERAVYLQITVIAAATICCSDEKVHVSQRTL